MRFHNARTYWAIFVSWCQVWMGWLAHAPGRVVGWWRVRTGQIEEMPADEFARHIAASIGRIKAAESKKKAAQASARHAIISRMVPLDPADAGAPEGGPGPIAAATCGVCRAPLYIGPFGWECRNEACEDLSDEDGAPPRAAPR